MLLYCRRRQQRSRQQPSPLGHPQRLQELHPVEQQLLQTIRVPHSWVNGCRQSSGKPSL